MGFWHWGRAGLCSPGFVTPSSSLTRVNLVWIFTFPCHRFSHFDAVAGVNFDVTRHRAGFQVTTWGCWRRFSRYLEQIFGKLRFHEGNISGGGGERSYKTLVRGSRESFNGVENGWTNNFQLLNNKNSNIRECNDRWKIYSVQVCEGSNWIEIIFKLQTSHQVRWRVCIFQQCQWFEVKARSGGSFWFRYNFECPTKLTSGSYFSRSNHGTQQHDTGNKHCLFEGNVQNLWWSFQVGGVGGGSFPIQKLILQIFAIINSASVMNSRKNLQYDFPKMRGGGQRPFGTFPENSSVLVLRGIP